MTQTTEMTNKIPAETIQVPTSKMFSYPTRLSDAYVSAILEISKPGYQLDLPEIEYSVVKGVTESSYHIVSTAPLHKKIYSKAAPPLKFEDDRIFYDARYTDQGNVAHMLIDIMPLGLFIARNGYPNLTVILNKNAKETACKICDLMGISYIKTPKKLEGQIISLNEPSHVLVETKLYQPIFKLYDELYEELVKDGERENLPEKVFISRRGSRNITNEPEIEQVLINEYGFQKFYFEDIPMVEQWSIMRHAKAVVGIHGAAFGALMFNRSQPKILEFFNPGYIVKSIRNITAGIGGKWCGVMGQLPEEYKESDVIKNPRLFATSSVTVDPESLKMALNYLEIK